jgi:sigma-54-dependent transcriptional regulator
VGDFLESRLVGGSRLVAAVRRTISTVAPSNIPVLIVGETGTGKDVCAQLIAALSGRSPYVPVNCAALPEGLVESELFGHERGAFTGASARYVGLIAKAHGGTLFMDELAEVPKSIQTKLLRVLENGEYRAVGSTDIKYSHFRLVAATHGDVDDLAESGQFRPDLFYRLGAMRIRLPALRERPEDISYLVEYWIAKERPDKEGGRLGITAGALSFIESQAWPGNVRQLMSVLDVAELLAGPEGLIRAEHVLSVLDSPAPMSRALEQAAELAPLSEIRRRAEVWAVREALRRADGNRERAAALLSISPATFYRKLSNLSA